MPFVINDGVRVYYETLGNGPPIVLHHGMLGSGADWADLGYIDALKNQYQLILVDARGHGRSDKPHQSKAYRLPLWVEDIVAILNDLDIQKAGYLGYSLGGWVGFGLAKHAAHRFNSFIFGAAHPFPEDMQPFRDLIPREREAFAAMIDRIFGPTLTAPMRSRLLSNDLDAVRTLIQDRDSNAEVLQSLKVPCLLYVGDLDPRLDKVLKCGAQLPQATVVTLPACDHAATLLRTELVVPRIREFLSSVHSRTA